MSPLFRVARGGAPEHRSFEELLAANLDALYRTALRLCRGRVDDAEDLVQEAVLRAFTKRDRLRDQSAGRSWLFTTLVRSHLNRVRAERRRHETLESDCDGRLFERALAEWTPVELPDDSLDDDAMRATVRAAIDELEPALRDVLLLADLEEFSHREVAAMLEIPEGTVASRLFRARGALKSAVSARPSVQRIRRSV